MLVYAIGDVHGCLDLLLQLERKIVAEIAGTGQCALVIMLGDYVDRGPDSPAVIDHLLAVPPTGIERLCLAGNHEEAMLAFLGDPKRNADWLEFGGRETMLSYGFELAELHGHAVSNRALKHKIDALIPSEHFSFLRQLPSLVVYPHHIFVHAGLRPGVAPDAQDDRDLLWIRQPFLDDLGVAGRMVVHGHTPVDAPFVSNQRVNVDTGAYMSGHLSTVKILDGEIVDVLTS